MSDELGLALSSKPGADTVIQSEKRDRNISRDQARAPGIARYGDPVGQDATGHDRLIPLGVGVLRNQDACSNRNRLADERSRWGMQSTSFNALLMQLYVQRQQSTAACDCATKVGDISNTSASRLDFIDG